ncbi:GNAT family N-acetyltransferase [Jatrophihabitans sp. YIM 134969]
MALEPTYPIVTARLRLRPLTHADAAALLTYRSDPEVCRYLPFEPMSAATIAERLDGMWRVQALREEGDALTLGIERASDGRLVGDVILFFRSAEHRGGELGYVLHPDAVGHGYVTEASTALLDLAFDPDGGLALHRVIAQMDARNTASARVAGRLGFRHEAHLVENELFEGEWSDLDVHAVLEREWLAARAARLH